MYYSGKNSEYTYIIIASAIVGPFLLIVLTIICFLAKKSIDCENLLEEEKNKIKTKTNRKNYSKEEEKNKMKTKTNRKNLVVFVLIGIYISFYIWILDILALHTVVTSSHEYEEELSTRKLTSNLGASIGTFICDTIAIIWTMGILAIIIVSTIYHYSTSLRNKMEKYMEKFTIENDYFISSILFPSLLLSPFICVTSHLGYIVLAWVTEPSRSTTTLILYYFILFYLFISIRMSYKFGMKLLAKSMPKEEAKSEKVYHSVVIFFWSLGLGIIYLSLAVLFIVFVYLKPLASEDLFNYLFNVIQFMIVVVSTQYFYKLFTGNSFSIKGVIKNVHKKISDKYPEMYESMEDHHLDNKTGRLVTDLIATKLDHVYNNTRSKTSPLHSRDNNIDTPPAVDSSTPSGVVSIPMHEIESDL